MLAGGIVGAVGAFLVQFYGAAISYPLNVGGRPLNSWPAFVPSAWEICALLTVFAGFFAFFAYCRLPRLCHPIFAAPNFERATQDRFFLMVEASDPRFDDARIRKIFEEHGAVSVVEVPA